MFHIIPGLLSTEELKKIHELIGKIAFADGRVSNPDYTKKNNLQPLPSDPAQQQASVLLQQALFQNEYFRDYCQPRRVAPPMVTKYVPGMAYGEHVDSGFIPYNPPLRIDVSCTIFLSDPASYQGGELEIRLADRKIHVKEKAGAAVFYPSTFFHQVRPVTEGQRIVAITFIESMIRDVARREILLELTEFLHENATKVGVDAQMRLEYVKTNLFRMWHED